MNFYDRHIGGFIGGKYTTWSNPETSLGTPTGTLSQGATGTTPSGTNDWFMSIDVNALSTSDYGIIVEYGGLSTGMIVVLEDTDQKVYWSAASGSTIASADFSNYYGQSGTFYIAIDASLGIMKLYWHPGGPNGGLEAILLGTIDDTWTDWTGTDGYGIGVLNGNSLDIGVSRDTSNFTGTISQVRYWDGSYEPSPFQTSDISNISNITSGIFSLSTIPPPILVGQVLFTTTGTTTWDVPAGITSICVVCVGGGEAGENNRGQRGGGGGALAYVNSISVTPGETLSIQVGAGGDPLVSNGQAGTNSWIQRSGTSLCEAQGGGLNGNQSGGTVIVGTGGAGGAGGNSGSGGRAGGGGGAGGYSGAGGAGADSGSNNATAGTGGAGGGGGSGAAGGAGGGGVGVLGEGTSGAAGTSVTTTSTTSAATGGGGGSGGTDGTGGTTGNDNPGGPGGLYGAGGGGRGDAGTQGGNGGDGAVRIIWGDGRAFPSTNVGDV